MTTVLMLCLAALAASPNKPVIDAAVEYAGAWGPEKNESARLRTAEKSCGAMFDKARGTHPQRKTITHLRSAQCRLPGLEASTVAAFNAHARREEPGWDLTSTGFSADLHGAGSDHVAHKSPSFSASGKQALIRVEVTVRSRPFGLDGPVELVAYDMLLLLVKKPDASWAVVHAAVLEARPLN